MAPDYVAYLQDVLISLHANIRELKERKAFADPEEQGYIEGKLIAYEEVLGILRDSTRDFGISRAEIGL